MNSMTVDQTATPARSVLTRYGWWFIGIFVVGFAVVAQATQSGTSTGGSFYASPGWTINRAADLSVSIQYDDGVSSARADCAMKQIVGGMTWLAWQSLSKTDQMATIIVAKSGC